MGRVWLELTVILECSSITEPSLAEENKLSRADHVGTFLLQQHRLNHEIEASLDCMLRPYLTLCSSVVVLMPGIH